MNRNTPAILGIALLFIFVAWQVPANILGVFTSISPSHIIVHMSLMTALAEKGHNITVVLSTESKVNHENINVIFIPPNAEQQKILDEELGGMAAKKNNFFTIMVNFFGSLSVLFETQADAIKDPRFTVLYNENLYKFDLMFCGFSMNSFQFGVAAKLRVPLILSWPSQPMSMVNTFVGNPNEISFVPGMNVPLNVGEKMTFMQRLQTLFLYGLFEGFTKLIDIRMQNYYKNIFPSDGSFPSLEDMYKNVSLIFCNSHFSEGPIRPNVPALVEIGGIQVKDKPQALPKDIEKFLDSANETGAVLFSLGSNLKGSRVRPETSKVLFNVLSKLQQKVIWKWEDLEHTPGKSSNILFKKWMPQDDILAHRNVKLFITHAGKGGIAEAQYHGVPMVALPVMADQHGNAGKMSHMGYGQSLDLLTLDEKSFKSSVSEVLGNPMYAENVQKFSRLYRDRPQTARESVVYWTEYVLRHHGAAHMQSPLVHMNFISSNNLDVLALIALVAYIIYRLFKLIFKFICSKCSRKNSNVKSKKVKKQ